MSDPTPTPTPTPPRRRGRRVILLTSLGLLSLPLLLLIVVWVALRFEGVRQKILDVAAGEAQKLGVRLEANDFSVALLAGAIEIRDLRLGVTAPPDAPPFLTAPRARVELVWGSLLTGKPTLRSLVLETPVLDLGAPLPASEDDEPPGEAPKIELLRYAINGGRVVGAPLPAAEAWLESWSFERGEAEGSYRGGELTFELSSGELMARLADRREIALAAQAKGTVVLPGNFQLDNLRLDGEGLHLEATGEGGTAPGEPLATRFKLEADPGVFLPEGAGSRVTAAGQLDLRTWVGEADVEVRELPIEVLEPWLGDDRLAQMGVAGSRLDLTAHLAAPDNPEASLGGTGKLVWKHPEANLAEASFAATLARAAQPSQLDLKTLRGTASVQGRELPIDLLAVWLDPLVLARWGAKGTQVDLDADLTLEPAQPAPLSGEGRLVWRREQEMLAEAQIRALPATSAAAVRLGVDLTLLPAEPGSRRVTGTLGAASLAQLVDGRLENTKVEIALPDLAAARADLTVRFPALVPAISADLPLAGSLRADATLSGRLRDPEARLDARWQRSGADLTLAANGRPLARRGTARLEVAVLDLALLGPPLLETPLSGTVSGNAEVSGSPEAFEIAANVGGEGLRYGTQPPVDRLRLELHTDGRELRIGRLEAAVLGREITAEGSATLERPLRVARLDFTVLRPVEGVERLTGNAALVAGNVDVDLVVPPELGRGRVVARVPLGALRSLPDLAPTLTSLPVEQAAGLVTVDLDLEEVEAQAWLERFEAEGMPRRLEAGVEGQLRLDLGDLSAAQGKLVVTGFEAANENYQLRALSPLTVTLGNHRLDLARWPLDLAGRRFELEGGVELTPGWQLEDAPSALVRAVRLDAQGQLEMAILNPFLAGGAASGIVTVDAHVRGPLDNLQADATLSGPQASVFFFRPYATKIEALRAKIVTKDGQLCFEGTGGRLNEGTFELEGCRTPEGNFDLRTNFKEVRYRLDYGLSATVAGNLRLRMPAEGRSLLSGDVLIERAVVRRNLDLDQLLRSQLFTPLELRGTADNPAEAIDLDLTIRSRSGLRVRNNLADLRASWDELEVRGTLAAPLVRGQVDLDPEGLVYGYGQTLRIDEGRIIFSGQPGAAPVFEWSTTTSLEDPTLTGERGPEFWTPGAANATASTLDEQVTLGLSGFFGTQLAGRAGGGLQRIRFDYRPVLVFFEEDPSGRLTIAQDLSRQVLFAVSWGLRDSQDKLYILDLHRLPRLPGVSSQIFTNDQENIGATLQHTLGFGERRGRNEGATRLRKIESSPPEGISERDLLRASGYEKGQRISERVLFDVEVDVTDYLRTHGYPEAETEVALRPVKSNEVDLVVEIAPGPRARFEFTGTQPPKGARASITSLYRSDFYEPAALEEMRAQTVLALRSRGFLDPQVSVEVVFEDPADPRGPRLVQVHSEGGEQVDLDKLVFTEVEEADAELLALRLAGRAERVELAAGVETADRRLLRELGAIGYPEAQIRGREIVDGGEALRVDLAPGPRQKVAAIEIVGATPEQASSWKEDLTLRAGDPLRSDQVGTSVVVLQQELAELGYTEANVVPVLTAIAPDRPHDFAVRFEVEQGAQSTIESIEVEGLEKTRPSWVRRLTGFEVGEVLDPKSIAEARKRLFSLNLFDRVAIVRDRDEEGRTKITLDLDEKSRYLVSYGFRWESGEGFGVVVDALDRNFLGRGINLGLRTFYTDDDRLARFSTTVPRIFNTRATLEFFLEGRTRDRVTKDAEDMPIAFFRTNSLEGSLQFSVPFTEKLIGRVYGRTRDTHTFEFDRILPGSGFNERISHPYLGWQALYDSRNDKTEPSHGNFTSVDLSGASSFLAGDFKYLRFYGQTYFYRTVTRWGGRPVVWAQSVRGGWLERSSETQTLPETGFLTGGDTSVRGYETESLGLLGGTRAEPIGGDALLVLNSELRFPIWADYLRGVVFVDAGNAWEDNANFGSDLAKSVGLGLRGATPLGLLRLDVAYPLDRPEDEDRRYWIYFGFGNTF